MGMYQNCYFLKYQFKIAIVFLLKTHYISNIEAESQNYTCAKIKVDLDS